MRIDGADAVGSRIAAEIEGSDEGRYFHRLHGILLVCRGFSCGQVADVLGCSVRTVHNWIRRFREEGPAGLQENRRTGRRASLSPSALEQLRGELSRSPSRLGYRDMRWGGRLLQEHLEREYGVTISVRQCQRLFHRLGIREVTRTPSE